LYYCPKIIRAIESKKDEMDTVYGMHGRTKKIHCFGGKILSETPLVRPRDGWM